MNIGGERGPARMQPRSAVIAARSIGPRVSFANGGPKGYQGPGEANATIVYINGAINSLSGTLGQNEQTTIAASDTVTITGNIQDQTPPNPSDPTSNPTNLLAVYSSGGDIVIGPSAPNNLVIQAVLMAGGTDARSPSRRG